MWCLDEKVFQIRPQNSRGRSLWPGQSDVYCHLQDECTGIYLFNKNVFIDLDFLPSTHRQSQEESFVREINVPSVDTDDADAGLSTPKSNEAAVAPSRDLATPGSSRAFQNCINKISPVPENLQTKLQSGREKKNEVPTVTPYKQKLEEKEEVRKQKKERAEKRRVNKENEGDIKVGTE